MNFKPIEDEDYLHCLESETGLVRIGIWRVLFGFRVRAGIGDVTCDIDWCAGNKWKDVERLYSICLSILSQRKEDKNCFEGIPSFSRIKPFYLDKDFVETITKLSGSDLKLMKLKKPDMFN